MFLQNIIVHIPTSGNVTPVNGFKAPGFEPSLFSHWARPQKAISILECIVNKILARSLKGVGHPRGFAQDLDLPNGVVANTMTLGAESILVYDIILIRYDQELFQIRWFLLTQCPNSIVPVMAGTSRVCHKAVYANIRRPRHILKEVEISCRKVAFKGDVNIVVRFVIRAAVAMPTTERCASAR